MDSFRPSQRRVVYQSSFKVTSPAMLKRYRSVSWFDVEIDREKRLETPNNAKDEKELKMHLMSQSAVLPSKYHSDAVPNLEAEGFPYSCMVTLNTIERCFQ